MSSLVPRLPVRTGLALLAVLAGLVVLAHSVTAAPLKAAITCQEDWEAIIATIEGGGTSYEGTCAFYGNPTLSTEVPAQIRDELTRARTEVETLAGNWTGVATPRTAAAIAGGLPLIVSMLILGAVSVASEVKAGTTSWLLSNGWTRRRYLVEKWMSLAVASAAGYVVAVAIEAVLITRDIDGRVGLQASVWGWEVVTVGAVAWVGAWIYTVIGMIVGLALGSPELAILVSTLVLGTDTLMLSTVSGPVLSPAAAVATTLRGGNPAVPASWVTALEHVTAAEAFAWTVGWALLFSMVATALILLRRFQARPARPA